MPNSCGLTSRDSPIINPIWTITPNQDCPAVQLKEATPEDFPLFFPVIQSLFTNGKYEPMQIPNIHRNPTLILDRLSVIEP
ncbi:hypothetical protein MES5069_520140 [Mesorhizobium escarrei]|uniref:GNAT family N-acetyltransferase n=1 Tax=Mesorhizobium escarrei TaxID=666018 RepID=A0ABM9EB72_9HYPH|nr:hypothetical protein MES5069_520140 [Mesorhizobium escarrei]